MALDNKYGLTAKQISEAISDGILTHEEAESLLNSMEQDEDEPVRGFQPDQRMPDMNSDTFVTIGGRGGVQPNNAKIGRFFSASHIYYDNVWMRYNGRIYSRIDEIDVDRIIYELCATYIGQDGEPYIPTITHMNTLMRYLKANLRPEHVALFPKGMEDEAEQYSEADGAYNIVFRNGVLHIHGNMRTLLDFTPYILCTNMVNADYDPNIADDRAVRSILMNILPDLDTFQFFYEMVGYILYSKTMNPPAIFLLYGPGNTGKTALHRMIAHVVGEENVSTLGLTQITSRFGTAELNGKLLNVCGETGGQSRKQTGIDGELLKKLTDGQVVTVEEKGKKPYQMRNTAKLLFVSNTPPDFGDYSSGMNRRMYTILCNKPQDPTKDIYAPLTTDTAQTWLAMRQLDAYIEWIARKNVFSVSLSMKEEGQMQAQEDPIKFAFMELFGTTEPFKVRAMVVSDDVLCIVAELYKAVRTIWLNNGIPPFAIMSQHKFTARVRTDYYMSVKLKRVPDGLNGTKPMRVYVIPDSEIRMGMEVAE